MNLSEVYLRGMFVARAVYGALGYCDTWVRWPSRPEPHHLDRLPVVIRPQDEGEPWVVSLDHDSIGGTEWAEFSAKVKTTASAKLAAIENLKEFAREHKAQYSALWRAKNGEGVTDRIIDMMDACPDVVVQGPGGLLLWDFGSEALLKAMPKVRAAVRHYAEGRGDALTLTVDQFNDLVNVLATHR